MDPFSIAVIAAPYVAKGAEAIISAVGEKLGEEVVDELKKLKDDPDAETILERVKEKPESKELQSALARVLAEKICDDPAFAKKMRLLVNATSSLSPPSIPHQIPPPPCDFK